MIKKDAITELKIQNFKDAYVALFNALGPKHYATLQVAFDLAQVLMEDADDMDAALPYLRDSYEGLKGRDAEMRDMPWKPGVYYALALMAAEDSQKCLEVSDALLDKYGDMAEEDLVSYLFLQEFRFSIHRAAMDTEVIAEIALATYETVIDYLEQDDPKYLHWLMLSLLSLCINGDEEKAEKLLDTEKECNILDGYVENNLVELSLEMIEAYIFNNDEDDMKEELKELFARLVRTDEFADLEEDEMREYFSALSPLFIPIQDEVGLEIETDDEE